MSKPTAEERHAAVTAKVKEIAAKFEGMTLLEASKAMFILKQKIEKLAKEQSALQVDHDFLSYVFVPELAEEAGVESMVLKVGKETKRLKLTGDAHINVLANKKEDAFDWLRANGHEDLIKETVAANSLKAVLKADVEKGVEIPTDVFRYDPFTRAHLEAV